MVSNDDLETVKKEFEHKVGKSTILFLDLSSSCTGYTIAQVDFSSKTASFTKAGAIWLDTNLKNQEKYHFIFNTITNYFNIVDGIDYCICEAYMLNPKKRQGSQVGPELHGAVQVALAEIGVKYSTIPVQTWRKLVGVKKDSSGDFKEPTKQAMEKLTGKIPDKILSNVTKNLRDTPYDLTDALGIGVGALTKLGINKILFNDMEFQPDVNVDL